MPSEITMPSPSAEKVEQRPRGDSAWMRLALELADQAAGAGDEVPVGALLVSADGRLLSAMSGLATRSFRGMARRDRTK